MQNLFSTMLMDIINKIPVTFRQFEWSDSTIRTVQRNRLVIADDMVNHTVYLMVTERVLVRNCLPA